MTIALEIVGAPHLGHSRRVLRSNVHSKGEHNGIVAYTQDLLDFNPEVVSFLNPSKGNAMNQNVGFTGNPTVVHAGVNSGALLTGTTTGTTSSHLIDSGETFSEIAVGMSVKNTTSGTEYARVTAVSANDLTLDTDILVSGENYEINPIWVGTAIIGTWNFADSGKITITTADNGDEASFDNDTNQQWDVGNVTTLTGKVDLDVYDPAFNSILISFDLNDTLVGDVLNINNYIDTANFAEQSFVIPKGDFNFGTMIINGMTLQISRMGGSKPTIKFDDIQWEETGESLVYTVAPAGGERFHVTQIRYGFADNETGILTDGTMPSLSFNKLLSVPELANGIVFRRVENTETIFSVTLHHLSDFLSTGADLINVISDGSNTFFSLIIDFPEAMILDGGSNDFISLTISDNLSSLLQFTAVARGSVEIEKPE